MKKPVDTAAKEQWGGRAIGFVATTVMAATEGGKKKQEYIFLCFHSEREKEGREIIRATWPPQPTIIIPPPPLNQPQTPDVVSDMNPFKPTP